MRSPYSRVDHIAMVVLATVGCLLLLAPQRDPVFTHGVPRPPGRSNTLNCRILNSTLKLSSCDDNYDDNYVYPLLITGVGRFQCINQIVAARLNHDLHAICTRLTVDLRTGPEPPLPGALHFR